MPRWAPTQEQIDLIARTPVDEILLGGSLWSVSTMSLPNTTFTDAAKTMRRSLTHLELEPAHDIVDSVFTAQAGCDAHTLILETLLWLQHQISGVDPTENTSLKGYPTRERYIGGR